VYVTALRVENCEECGTRLNQYNQSGVCGPCHVTLGEKRKAEVMGESGVEPTERATGAKP
jgi:hypothetical protein